MLFNNNTKKKKINITSRTV